jgi:hypothetical protein
VTERAGEERLAHADGAEEDHVLAPLQEGQVEEVPDPVAVEGDRHVPVEVLEGVLLVEAGAVEPVAEILLLSRSISSWRASSRKSSGFRLAFWAYAARSGRMGTMPESLSRFSTALSEGFTSTMVGLLWRGVVGEALCGPREAAGQGDHPSLSGFAREKLELLEVLAQDGFDAPDVDEVEGEGALTGDLEAMEAVLLAQAQELLALAELGPGHGAGEQGLAKRPICTPSCSACRMMRWGSRSVYG